MFRSVLTVCLCTTAAFSGHATAQGFPSRDVHIIVSSVGGSSDGIARQIAPGMSELLGQPVVVDNRAGVNVTGEIVEHAPPDGYTLLLIGESFWIAPFLQKMPYDPVADFAPIALTVSTPAVLVVHSSLPVKSVKDLIDLAKSRPGELNYASPGTGSAYHLSAELLKSSASVNIVRIPYVGLAKASNALLGGEIQVMFMPPALAMPYVKTGKLRALAITSAEPSALTPGLPTIASSGVPGYDAASTQAMFAPAHTPAAVISRLNREIVRVLNRPEVKDRLLSAGVETVGSTPEALAQHIKADMDRMGKVIKDAGIQMN
jgi:tripartite-type tricarboxylate transporter receptor subunit TctC